MALFPLLDMLTRATHPLELIAFLGRSMEAASARQLLEWLWSRQMIEPAVFGA
ncbi:hypothetical protein [Burkholderia lata]|uniref:hypothetical protein n=1 Tax=Burkholderia lata (strain ATCC 17760 / DSM 23089 / LMG 22485 / NCIMB 9086 / R18194 / 383) TaxID=482957 RepID=UPI0015830143|nr:hypothetical protein [Burkholderia lata]